MKKGMNGLLLIGLIGTCVFGSQFGIQYGRAVWGNKDNWWTPRSLALSFEETQNEFRLFVDGISLREHLAQGTLVVQTAAGEPREAQAADIEVRLNNWPRIKSTFLHIAIFPAFFLGVSLACLVLGIVRWVRPQETQNHPSGE